MYLMSFEKGIFPDKLKTSKIIPIYKKGDTSLMTNYRPITLSSVFNKILERLMYNRLISFLNKHNILYNYQFGFRKGFSTSLALFEVLQLVNQELANNNLVMGLFLDLQKAFDTVNHSILLEKLSHYGIRGCSLEWFHSFLNNRSVTTSVNNFSSSSLFINCRVPQDSVLGPLLFLIYINDISNANKSTKIRLFADDSNVFIIHNDIYKLFDEANIVINDLNHWFICNKLSINFDKTTYMIFKPTRNVNDIIQNSKLNISVNNVVIGRTNSTKYLGIHLDEMLCWKDHVQYLNKKISSVIGIFYSRRFLLTSDCKRTLYYSLIYPYLIYGLEVYGLSHFSVLKPLLITCNRALRVLQNKPRDYPVTSLQYMQTLISCQLIYYSNMFC